jgi:hypothetical protein
MLGQFVKLKNGKPFEVVSRPNWLEMDGSEITDDTRFIEAGIWPLVHEDFEYDHYTQEATRKEIADWQINDNNVTVTYEVTDRPLEDAKTLLKMEVDRIRYRKIYSENIPYVFPGDTEPDGIQMRNEVDRQNIQDLVIDAMTKDPETPVVFMPISNNLKTLSAQDLIKMGIYIKSRGDAIVAYAWSLKEQINEATSLSEIRSMAATIEDFWP